MLKKDEFDIVLSDVIMPGMDGLRLLEFIHSLSSQLPVLFMSAPGSINRSQALEQDATDLILKPFDPEELLSKLKLLLERYNHIKAMQNLAQPLRQLLS